MTTVRIIFHDTPLTIEGQYEAGSAGCVSGPPDSWVQPDPPDFAIDHVWMIGRETRSANLAHIDLMEHHWLIEPHLDAIEQACIEKLESACAEEPDEEAA